MSFPNIADKLVEQETNPKYYFADNGILSLLLLDANTSLLENLVAVSLLRKYSIDDAVFFYNKLKSFLSGNGYSLEHRLCKPPLEHPRHHHIQTKSRNKSYNRINQIVRLNVHRGTTKQYIEGKQTGK